MNCIEIVDGVKLFYVPVILLSIFGLLFVKYELNDFFIKLILSTIILSLVPCITNNADFPFAFILIVLSLIGIPFVYDKLLYKLSAILLPITLILMLVFAEWSYGYRFYGFYNDPNYLALSMLCGMYLSMQMLLANESLLWNFISSLSVVMLVYVVFLTQSRGGIFSLSIFMLIALVRIYKTNYKSFIYIVFLLICEICVLTTYSYDGILTIIGRFVGERYSDVEAAGSRLYEIESAIDAILREPLDFLFGTGIGFTNIMSDQYRYIHRIHNTIIAILYENGAIEFCLFGMAFFYILLKNIRNKSVSLALYFSMIIGSMTVWTLIYLPFWFGIFLSWKNTCFQYKKP